MNELYPYSSRRLWPLLVAGALLFGIGFLVPSGWMAYVCFLAGAVALSLARFLTISSYAKASHKYLVDLGSGADRRWWARLLHWLP